MKMNCSPFARNIYKRICDSGAAGFNPAKSKVRGVESALAELRKEKVVIILNEYLVLPVAQLIETAKNILEGKKPGSPLSMEELKNKSGMSRRVLIPILEHLDQTGLTEKRGPDRFVLAEFDENYIKPK